MNQKTHHHATDMETLWACSQFDGVNANYLEALYESWLQDPDSVAENWRQLFSELAPVPSGPDVRHSKIREEFREIARVKDQYVASTAGDAGRLAYEHKQICVLNLIEAYRFLGHQQAALDPLSRKKKKKIPDLALKHHDLHESDLDIEFETGSPFNTVKVPLSEILMMLKETYCGSIGIEYMHIVDTEEKQWLQHKLESARGNPKYSPEFKCYILERLTAAEGLEHYLHSKYVGQKRFSIEGGESLIPMLDHLMKESGISGIKECVLGMAHRGRLNVLVNIMGKNPADLFQEFEGRTSGSGSGDVKYHMGFSSDIKTRGGTTHLAMAFNPSHLEIVSPVVEGSVRARQDRRNDKEGNQVLAIIVHGDAAFAGQGVVMETFNMSQSRGFSTKGTIHIVINNQIGFTTSNQKDSRSTYYCTDVAKMVNAPILHVNGDDPEAVCFVTKLALEYRMRYKKDIVIDMVCYRRHGHNEADEPSATQPMMYEKIRSIDTTRTLYAKHLISQGVLNDAEDKQLIENYRLKMDAGECAQMLLADSSEDKDLYIVDWSQYMGIDWDEPCDTRIDADQVKALNQSLLDIPEGHAVNPRVQKILEDRRKMGAGAMPLDWGFAETMAYAALVTEGYPVRLTGQDSGRGTFFHRHAVLHNQNNGGTYIPLQHLSETQEKFLVVDSLLSEEAVLAFEYGYSTSDPHSLVIWEAQFGDFANGAQVVIDQFISSGEQKWNRLCGLTLLLPHGYEGQGPEHSSARLERYLQLCAEHNIQVCYPTTPSQIFHLLRRQAVRPCRKPLVVMTPKSLLRHKRAVSTLDELSQGAFMPVLNEPSMIDGADVKRIIFCTGKVYYDLVEYREANNIVNTVIIRIEQLYPFPEALAVVELEHYPNAEEFVWCQEEPMNQGPWYSIQHRVRAILHGEYLHYAGREASASPAVGSAKVHVEQQKRLIESAFRTLSVI